MSSRDKILGRLRRAATPFEDVPPITQRRIMVPMADKPLVETFIQCAEALSAHVVRATPEEAITAILAIIAPDSAVLAWDFAEIPLDGLREALERAGIQAADPRQSDIRVGITGVEAAFAATGSVVVSAVDGHPRTVSLLPDVHIAVIQESQILPHFDAWIEAQRADLDSFRKIGNTTLITGASRTADIAMELVLGAHGPAQLHLILIP